MSLGHSTIQAGDHIFLRLPSGALKPIDLQPKTALNIGKFGSFHSKSLIGRPYYLTYEILDKLPDEKHPRLRVVPAAELNSETLSVDNSDDSTNGAINANGAVATEAFEIVGEDGEVLMRNNRLTIDDPSRQALTLEEIEDLKKAGTDSGKEVIVKIMAAHSALGEKTTFSLAKYTLRKTKKYLKRFQVLPMDVGLLTEYMLERDPSKIMDLREDVLSLLCSWANVHHAGNDTMMDEPWQKTGGRVLVVDDTGGLVVAALAEHKGILYRTHQAQDVRRKSLPSSEEVQANGASTTEKAQDVEMKDGTTPTNDKQSQENNHQSTEPTSHQPRIMRRANPREMYQTATRNSITLVHTATQPNLSTLKYFNYALEDTNPDHPLFTNLKTLTWLQLLDPESDAVYSERPEELSAETLEGLKSGKRSTYYRKLRRWIRVNKIVRETRAGGYDSLVVTSHMEAAGVLRELVPLVKGGGQIVVYSPHVEPLTALMDLYSRDRRAAYQKIQQQMLADPEAEQLQIDEDDFPLNPTLVLNPMLQTARAVEWQVLPGRTHPLMTSRGGSEGYIFSATRVIPVDGTVHARGKFHKKRKAEADNQQTTKKRKDAPTAD